MGGRYMVEYWDHDSMEWIFSFDSNDEEYAIGYARSASYEDADGLGRPTPWRVLEVRSEFSEGREVGP